VVQLVGVALLWFALPSIAEFSIWQLVPGLVISGIGTGLIAAPIFDTILSTVEPQQSGSASGVMSAVQSVFSSVGVAIFGTVFFTYALLGQADVGFRTGLIVQVVVVVGFVAVVSFLPKRAQHLA
jgi:MFS family permease